MSGTLPTSPGPRSVVVRSLSPILLSTSHSLKRQVRTRGGQRWAFDLQWAAMRRDAMAPIAAFLTAQRGGYETFTYRLGHELAPRGTWAGTPLVKGASQTGRSVLCDGFTAGATVKAGDWVKFNGHAKVYAVTADASADGSGNLTLAIEPALVVSPPDNDSIVSSSVPFTVALAEDVIETSVGLGRMYQLAAKFIEVP